MADLLPIQLGPATNGQTGALASPAGADATVFNFAAVLAGLFNSGPGSATNTENLAPAGACNPDPDDATQSSALFSDTAPSGASNESEQPPQPAARPLPIHDLAADKTCAASPTPAGALPGSKGAPQPTPVVSGDKSPIGDLNPDPLVPDGTIKSPEDSSLPADLLSEFITATQFGDPSNEVPNGEPTSAAGSGRDSDHGGNHIRSHRHMDQLAVGADQMPVGQVVSAVASTLVGTPSQPPTGIPSAAPRLSPDKAAALTAGVDVDSGRKQVEQARSLFKPLSAVPDHPSGRVSPSGMPTTEAEPEKLTIKSDPVLETATLLIRTEATQASPSTVATSSALKPDRPPPATPTDQIAPALVGVLQRTDGQQGLTIHLQPAELGQVRIRVDLTPAGTAHIAITAEKPETLQMLQREEPRLQQVLDQAGVLSSGRTVSFQMASQDQVGAAASRPDNMETGAGASGQGQSGGAWRQNGDTQNDFGRGPGAGQEQNRPRWFRAGLDITA